MYQQQKVVVVMPAYNAAKTLRRTYEQTMAQEIVDLVIIVDDFVFDSQILAQVLWAGYMIAEISCPTKYFKEASSINFWRSVRYGFGVLGVSLQFRLARLGLMRPKIFAGLKR